MKSGNLQDIDYLASTERRAGSHDDVPVEVLSADRARTRNMPAGVSAKAISSQGNRYPFRDGFAEYYHKY